MRGMKAILLAAGHGTRLRPLTDTLPKALMPVAGMPVIEHNLLLLRRHGIRDVIINVHAHPHAIPAYVGDGGRWGLQVTYSYEESLLGTAGAVKRVEGDLAGAAFAVVYADNLSDCNLTALYDLHRRAGAVATLALHEPRDPRSSGIVRVDETGHVRGFVEKPHTYDSSLGIWANAGVYILEPVVLDEIPPDIACDFGHDVFPRLLAHDRPLYAAPVCRYHLSIDTPERYAEAQEYFVDHPSAVTALINGAAPMAGDDGTAGGMMGDDGNDDTGGGVVDDRAAEAAEEHEAQGGAEHRAHVTQAEEQGAQAEDIAHDPAWRLVAWALPLGSAASALLILGQTLTGSLDAAAGYSAALALALLCVALVRDLRRRARSGRWVRTEVHEFILSLGLLLVALALLAHGALAACVPLILTLLPVGWGIVHAPRVERTTHLWPYALPVVDQSTTDQTDAVEGHADAVDSDEDAVEAIVREVVAGLPPDISARLEGWAIEVREELLPRPEDRIVYGMCFPAAHAIAIYRRPHLRHAGRGAALRQAVTYTVLHEIAHALGLDEAGVRRLGWLSIPTHG